MPLVVVIFTSLSQCGKKEVVEEQIAVMSCTDNELVPLESFENVSGTVITYKRKGFGANRDTIVYYVDAPSVLKTSTTPIGPCNLPTEVMKEGLKIKFSGYLLTPADPRLMLNVEALPFEITKLSLQTKN